MKEPQLTPDQLRALRCLITRGELEALTRTGLVTLRRVFRLAYARGLHAGWRRGFDQGYQQGAGIREAVGTFSEPPFE